MSMESADEHFPEGPLRSCLRSQLRRRAAS